MRTSFCIVLLTVNALQADVAVRRQMLPTVVSCLHDASATEADRNRRAQALTLAKAIHTAEAEAVRRTLAYQPLASLGNLPAVPAGFALKLFADRDDYVF